MQYTIFFLKYINLSYLANTLRAIHLILLIVIEHSFHLCQMYFDFKYLQIKEQKKPENFFPGLYIIYLKHDKQ